MSQPRGSLQCKCRKFRESTPRALLIEKLFEGRLSKAHGCRLGNGRTHRGKTVTKPVGLKLLELPLSEKQIPQVVENLESGREFKEALETA